MKNKIKTMIGVAAILIASSASAKCVVDGDYLKSIAKKETPTSIGCDVGIYVNDSSLKDIDKDDTFAIMSMSKKNIEVLDLTSLDSSMLYSISVKGNKKLEEIKIGEITRITKINIRKTKITDLTFLEKVPSVRILTDKIITKFPDEDSPFCEGAKHNGVDISKKENKAALIEACNIEVD